VKEEVLAIATELGLLPKGGYADVGARLNAPGFGVSARSGYYYANSYAPVGVAGGSTAIGTMAATPFMVAQQMTLAALVINVTTLGVGATPRLGVYASLPNGLPGNLLVDAGTVDASTIGAKEAAISLALSVGRYWMAYALQGSVGCSLWMNNVRDPAIGYPNAGLNAIRQCGWTQTGVSGALPASFSTTPAAGQDLALVYAKVA